MGFYFWWRLAFFTTTSYYLHVSSRIFWTNIKTDSNYATENDDKTFELFSRTLYDEKRFWRSWMIWVEKSGGGRFVKVFEIHSFIGQSTNSFSLKV